MQVNAAANGAVPGVSGQQRPAKAQGNPDNSSSSANQIDSSGPQPGANGQANGVTRLIQEGHFQGVSGLRLQINFNEQLSGITRQAVASTTNAGAESILTAVDSVVAQFVDGNSLDSSMLDGISAAQQSFSEAAAASFAEFQSGSIDSTQLLASLQTAFDDFLETIEALVPSDGTSGSEGQQLVVEIEAEVESAQGVIPTGGDIIPVEQTEAEIVGPDFAAFLTALGDAFSGALQELGAALASAENTVPEIAEPNGNGVAFAKFLDILNVIQGGGEDSDVSALDTQINTEG